MSIDDRQLCDHALDIMLNDRIISQELADKIRLGMDLADVIHELCRKQEDGDGVD